MMEFLGFKNLQELAEYFDFKSQATISNWLTRGVNKGHVIKFCKKNNLDLDEFLENKRSEQTKRKRFNDDPLINHFLEEIEELKEKLKKCEEELAKFKQQWNGEERRKVPN